jgi:hypothetical protein
MKKNIFSSVIIYLSAYVAVLILCALYDYTKLCNAEFDTCVLNFEYLNTIITTTSYVLAPLIAIVGFQSWKHHEHYKKQQEILELISDKTKDLNYVWRMTREHGDDSIFQNYRMKNHIPIIIDTLAISKVEQKIRDAFYSFNELDFLLTKFFINSNLDMKEIDECAKNIHEILDSTNNDFYSFIHQINFPDSKIHEKTEEEMQVICDKLDRYCNEVMGRGYKSELERKNFSEEIKHNIEQMIFAIKNLKRKI